jgi:hypothetical protein
MSWEPNTKRALARAAGEKFYCHDWPCTAGHTAPRYVESNHCVICSKLASEEYKRKNNPKAPAADMAKWLKERGLSL